MKKNNYSKKKSVISKSNKNKPKKYNKTKKHDNKYKDIKIHKIKNKEKENKKNNLIKKKNILFIVLIAFLLACLGIKFKMEKSELESLQKEQEIIKDINSHYNEFVKTNKESNIYNDKGEKVGKIGSDIELSLEKIIIDKNTKHFKIKDFENSYIKYQDVDIIDSLSIIDTRYKNYILFNQNIVTDNKTTFYDDNNTLVYEFYNSFNLPIIIKEQDKYGVEYNGRLLYVKKDDVKDIKNNYNTNLNNASGVAVLNYHAFYDENNATEVANCPTIICHSKKQFKQHLDYIKENNIFPLTMNEIEMYIDGKIQLPKSVLITIDDGGRTKHAVDMLTEYKMNATIFLVTAWFDPDEFYKSEYIELHSHSHDLHNGGDCPGGQGGAIKCLDREILIEDLKTSRKLLNNTKAFCFPFYEYNEYSISILKEVGFTMAFIGEQGDMLVRVGDDKFRLTRFVIQKSTTMYSFDAYFDKIKN